jgi:hypothetical protein
MRREDKKNSPQITQIYTDFFKPLIISVISVISGEKVCFYTRRSFSYLLIFSTSYLLSFNLAAGGNQ